MRHDSARPRRPAIAELRLPPPAGSRTAGLLRRRLVALAASSVFAAAQETAADGAVEAVASVRSDAALVAFDIEPPLLRSAFERCAAVLASGDPGACNSTGRASMLLGWLRLGRLDRARDVLDATAAAALGAAVARQRDATACPGGDAAWLVVQTYWLWRASRDEADLGTMSQPLDQAGECLLATPLPSGSDRALLHVHALACAEQLARSRGDERSALTFSLRARRCLDEHEAAHWRDEADGFVDADGAPPSLFGCAVGMLAATGDRIERNALRALRDRESTEPDRALVARTQFDLARARELEAACLAPVTDPVAAGSRLDALGFGATGLRHATGPGVDERWTRVRPCVLPGSEVTSVRGTVLDGWRVDVVAQVIRGALVVRTRTSPLRGSESWRQLVAHVDGRVFVTAARAGREVVLGGRSDADGAPVTSPDR